MALALLCLGLVSAACASAPSRVGSPATSHQWPTESEATACARNSSNQWMKCLVRAHPSFAHVPLSEIALPGAENAGTFNLDPQAFDNQMGSACTTIDALDTVKPVTVQRFSATQEQSITRQLEGGVRWIDLSVGYNGGGNPTAGWRVTQNLYSSWPLSEYLDEVANWASSHPSEPVVVDLSTICYDHNPTPAVYRGLWANFATKSVEGSGPVTLANVAARPSAFGGSLATATLADLSHDRHNVVVLVPAGAKDLSALRNQFHVDPVLTAQPGATGRALLQVERSDPRVAPTSPTDFQSANTSLAAFPKDATPPLGSLQGKGIYVSKLAYELKGASSAVQSAVFSNFVGLVAHAGAFPAMGSGLWSGQYQQILSDWGHASNVVIADGVDQGGFTASVIARNSR